MITLYSTNCSNCQMLKMLLVQNNIEFTENNSVDDMLALGITRVPVLSVSGKLMGYQESKEWIINNSRGDTE